MGLLAQVLPLLMYCCCAAAAVPLLLYRLVCCRAWCAACGHTSQRTASLPAFFPPASSLPQDTHKFESRYLDGLVGPYPEVRRVAGWLAGWVVNGWLNCLTGWLVGRLAGLLGSFAGWLAGGAVAGGVLVAA